MGFPIASPNEEKVHDSKSSVQGTPFINLLYLIISIFIEQFLLFNSSSIPERKVNSIAVILGGFIIVRLYLADWHTVVSLLLTMTRTGTLVIPNKILLVNDRLSSSEILITIQPSRDHLVLILLSHH